ncbi:MAG TPA: DUF2946 family protein [Pusillimonas sp.]|uniref:DUF2946 family protein n=1 Tax=unclassified Pusillimonas TaxID=2640016 RepID=UPI0026378EF9|nr:MULTISPECIES: DUF2946 family protein [unclassified Pusillimonas]HLU19843.1 DUF2946 family protein [Pusillimonas sp.]
MARSTLRHPVSWLVLLAFLFSTLAPSLAMGLGATDASRTVWAQLCSAEGLQHIAIQIDDDPEAEQQVTDSTQGHCLLCFQPSTSPEGISVAPMARAASAMRVHIAATSPPKSASNWSPGLARAPPFRS